MMVIVSGAQVSIGDVRVDLRSGNVAVPEKRLDRPRIRAVLQQVSGETVAERVWRNVIQTDRRRVSLDDGPGNLTR